MSIGDQAIIKDTLVKVKILSLPVSVQEYKKDNFLENKEYSVKVLFLNGDKKGITAFMPENMLSKQF